MDTTSHMISSKNSFYAIAAHDQPWTMETSAVNQISGISGRNALSSASFDNEYDFNPPMPVITLDEHGRVHRLQAESIHISIDPMMVNYSSDEIMRPNSAPPDAGWHARDVRMTAMDHADAALSLLDFASVDTRGGYTDYQNLFNSLNAELDDMTDCDSMASDDDEMLSSAGDAHDSTDSEDIPSSSVKPRRSMLRDFGTVQFTHDFEEEDDRPMRARNANYDDEPIRARSLEPMSKPNRKPVRAVSQRRQSDPSKPASAIPQRLINLLSKEKNDDGGAVSCPPVSVPSPGPPTGHAERGHLSQSRKVVIVSEVTISIDERFSQKKKRKMSTGVLGWNRLSWKSEESPEDAPPDSFNFESADSEILGTSLGLSLRLVFWDGLTKCAEEAKSYLRDQRTQLLKKISKRIKQQDAKLNASADNRERKKAQSQKNKLVRRQRMLKNLVVR